MSINTSNIPTRVVNNSSNQASTPSQQTSSEDRLLAFVDDQIQKFQKYTNLGNPQGMPGFEQLNSALINWGSINCALISMDVLAKVELQKAKDTFDDWIAEKYMLARATLNPNSLSATKWASSKEIEYYIRSTWNNEYRSLMSEVEACEQKVAFLRRMLDGWQSQLTSLNRLSRNVETEAIRLGGSFSD